MSTLSNKQQWLVGAALLIAMLLTRSHIVNHLQDASWAIFFLVGAYLRPLWAYPLFWLAAFAIDYTVISNGSVPSYCFTPAYGFTFIAYAALWASGRWFANQSFSNHWQTFRALGTAIISGTLLSFVISNLGFYTFAGYFSQMSMLQYAQAVVQYFPNYLATTIFYVGIAALIQTAMQYSQVRKVV
jgi:hypothetical protein